MDVYLIKANVALAVFYLFYRLLLSRDTFFGWRRATLLAMLAGSFLLPLPQVGTWIGEGMRETVMTPFHTTLVLPEFVLTATESGGGWDGWGLPGAGWLYLAGIGWFGMRLAVQLVSLLRMACRCPRGRMEGTDVRLLPRKESPFSFFRLIFIAPEGYSGEELHEMLTHERTHARQWHSIDILLGEAACICCWMNPFAWLLRREIRINLEYLADERVVRSGCDQRSYQFHLLELTCQKAAATIYNHFNVLPLKKRIRMMNKKRTHTAGRAKYLLALPLTALLMGISNNEAWARNNAGEPLTGTTVETVEAVPQVPDEPILNMSQKMPEFPGGNSAMMEFLKNTVKYPAESVKNKEEGRVVVSYVVEKDGSITNVEVMQSVTPLLDAEAVRVVSEMPKWTPGEEKGEKVRVRYVLPIIFKQH